MYLIQQVTDSSLQQQNLVLPDGTNIQIQIYFRPLQAGWFVNSLVYGSFVLQGLRITNSPNMFNQFRHQIPFGFACFSTNNREPTLQQDFLSGASKLYILTQAETLQYAEYLQLG